MFYRQLSSRESETPAVMGLSFLGLDAAAAGGCVRLCWSPRMEQALSAVTAAARNSGDAAGSRLPHATLRALLAAGLPGPVYVDSDLGGIGRHDGGDGLRPFAECAAPEGECLKAAATAVRMWAAKVLSPWAEARGLPGGFAEEVARIAVEESAATAMAVVPETDDAKGKGFPDVRDAIHAEAFRRIAGTELFPGLGPVRAIVRSSSRDSSIAFATFPKAAARGAWSMQVKLTVETLPGRDMPFVRLDVSRKRWAPDLPERFLPRQRRLTATVFGADERRAVSFHVPIVKGEVGEPEDPAYALAALKSGVDVGAGFAQLVRAGPRDGAFVGLAHSTAYDVAPSVATGATELDFADCFGRVAEAMKGVLEPLKAEAVGKAKRIRRDSEDIPAMKAAMVLEEIARTLGYNDVDDRAISETWDLLANGALPASVKLPANIDGQRERFDRLREDNAARLQQAFGSSPPVLAVVSASVSDAEHIARAAATMFNGRLRIETMLMPEGVHGPRKSLGNPGGKARERYADRVALWKPFARRLAEEFGPSRVIVHAGKFNDDRVNKIAGRVALARYGDCNVQYLDSKGPKVDDWFFRIQAAVLDLMFGHSALVSPVAANVAEAFPDPDARPQSIVGVSVVALNRTSSRQAASFFLSVTIDVATGRTTARAGRPSNGSVDVTESLPFFDLLKTVAGWDEADSGNGENDRSDFQAFVAEIVGDECERGRKPLVMIEGDHARALWPSVSNREWGRPLEIGGEEVSASEWPGARIVRVQDRIEPAVLTPKVREYEAVDPETGAAAGTTVRDAPTVARQHCLVRLEGPADNYVSTGDLDGTQKLPKGLSVYRPIPQMKAADAASLPPALAAAGAKLLVEAERSLAEEPYKLPGTVGLLVLRREAGDDPDRIAALCHGLRFGFGHTRSPVKLPAPLFHARKVAEYIPAYVLSEEDGREEEPEAADPEGPDDDDPPPRPDGEGGEDEAKPEPEAEAEADMDEPSSQDGRPAGGGELPFPPEPSTLPDHIRDMADGDPKIEAMMEQAWVGPLPSFFTLDWMASLLRSHPSARTRQLLYEGAFSADLPVDLMIPTAEIEDDLSFAEFLLVLLQIGEAMSFVRRTAPRTMDRNRRRWLFNPVYEQLAARADNGNRSPAGPSVTASLAESPFCTLRNLHEDGGSLLARQFLAIETMFMPSKAGLYAETAGRLKREFGSEYAEVEAFCLRAQRYHENLDVYREEWRAVRLDMARRTVPGMTGGVDEVGFAEMAEASEPPRPSAPEVDGAWLRERISLSGAFRSHLHGYRVQIRDALGDPKAWPDDKPSSETISDCVARLFSAPVPLLAAISRRDRESLFKPLYRRIQTTVKAIDEGRPEFERLPFAENWEEAGDSAEIFTLLAEGGYRQSADEFAKVRAIDNPSRPLEHAVAEAGEEFAETARFISDRRRATLWFIANDDRSDDPLYEDYLDGFKSGEWDFGYYDEADPPPSGTDRGEPRTAKAKSQTETAKEAELEAVDIKDFLRSIMEEARLALDGENGGAESLSRSLSVISALLEKARDAVAAMPTTVPNEALLVRARAMDGGIADISGFMGVPRSQAVFPEAGAIEPDSAAAAESLLDEGDARLGEARQAVEEYKGLKERQAAMTPVEQMAVAPEMYGKITEAQISLSAADEALAGALPRLAPAAAKAGPAPEPEDAAGPAAPPVPAAPEAAARQADVVSPPAAAATDDEDEWPEEDRAEGFDVEEAAPEASADEPAPGPMAKGIGEDGDPPESVPEALPAETADAERVNEALDRFMAAGSYALAHHLARASQAEDPARPLSVTPNEAKLAAIAGHLSHPALQANPELVRTWVAEALVALAAIGEDGDEERKAARLLTLMPIAAELAIFSPQHGSAEILRSISAIPGDLGKKAAEAFHSLDSLKHTTIVLSRAMLANVAGEMDLSKDLAESRAHLLQKFEAFQALRFSYMPGNKIKNELSRSDNLVGRLRAQIVKGRDDEATLTMVKGFAEALADRSAIVSLLDQTHSMTQDRSKGLDGVARNRLVAFLEGFRDAAGEYVEIKSEMDEASLAERPKARDLAKRISSALKGMTEAAEAAARDEGLLGTAAGNVALRLRKLSAVLSGSRGAAANGGEHLLACHAELALLPSLDYGRSWLPSPYVAPELVDLLCAAPLPLLPAEGPARDEAFEAVIRQRMGRGSFVGAHMLLEASGFFGINPELAENLEKEVGEGILTAKEAMKHDIGLARKIVERVMRFGSLRHGADAEKAASLLDSLGRIEAVDVPIHLEPNARSEEEVDGIFDVSVAQDAVEAIRDDAQALLEDPRRRLLKDIDALAAMKVDPWVCDKLRALCETDDLLTAEEHIQEVRNEGRLPESRRRNWRFEAFRDKVLPQLERYKGDIAGKVYQAISAGEAFEGLAYDQLPDTRREEAAGIVMEWREMFHKFHVRDYSAFVSSFLEKFGVGVAFKDNAADAVPPGAKERMYVGDFRLDLPTDSESLLLPDFGSRTQGNYRIAVSQSLPAESTLQKLPAGNGLLLLVSDVVSSEERRKFLMRNLDANRRVLLVDSASVAYAVAEQQSRALTLVELAQPYSFAEPYADWGRSAVPIEMFVGREQDIRAILLDSGSNVVYGGRRMGKTALLKHIETKHNDPRKGVLVGFVDAHPIGKGHLATKAVWKEIAKALPDVFPAGSNADASRATQAIKKWLADDDRRRIYLLLDECDQFIVSDAANDYTEFLALQQLMTDTNRRFKFVLAGLSNVTRLVQTGNPPLKQIASDPRRIGSLTGDERKAAEDLVLRPFAAMGLELERQDIWRILSHSNYYPILIQTYALHLLKKVLHKAQSSQKAVQTVPSDMVAAVLDDQTTKSEIKNIFDMTLGIDLRYQLIAYVVASLSFEAEAEGRMDDGFTTREIRERAIDFWEEGFKDKNRFSMFDDLLDEMEGLGIVRRIGSDRWALRSTAVVRLLGTRDEIDGVLLEFTDREAPVGFDPKSHRRRIDPAKYLLQKRSVSPLTLSQERDVLLSPSRATVILGNRLADYDSVPAVLKTVPDSFSDGENYDVRILPSATASEMAAALRDMRPSHGRKVVAVIRPSSPWTAEWVKSAINARPVAKGEVRVIFAGGPQHAASVAADGQLSGLTSHVDTMALEPWSTTFFNEMLDKEHPGPTMQRYEDLMAEYGGWNEPMSQYVGIAQKAAPKQMPEPVDGPSLGLAGDFGEALSKVLEVIGPASFGISDVDACIDLEPALKAPGMTGDSLVQYGLLMGLLSTAPGKPGIDRQKGAYLPTPLAAKLLDIVPLAAE